MHACAWLHPVRRSDPPFKRGSAGIKLSFESAAPRASAGTLFRTYYDNGTLDFVSVRWRGSRHDGLVWGRSNTKGALCGAGPRRSDPLRCSARGGQLASTSCREARLPAFAGHACRDEGSMWASLPAQTGRVGVELWKPALAWSHNAVQRYKYRDGHVYLRAICLLCHLQGTVYHTVRRAHPPVEPCRASPVAAFSIPPPAGGAWVANGPEPQQYRTWSEEPMEVEPGVWLPIFVEGALERQEPYHYIALRGAEELLFRAADSGR